MEQQGIALFAISYDRQAVLARFARRYGIGYPLLSDEGSVVIEQLGLLDRDLDRHHAEFGRETRPEQRGVAYPTTFVLDASGTVVERGRQIDYRTRETGAVLLQRAGGVRHPFEARAASATGPVCATAALDAVRVARYQRFRAIVDLEIEDGWHVYADIPPEGCAPLGLVVEHGERLVAGSVELLEEPDLLTDGTRAYVGRARLAIPLSFRVEAGCGDQEVVLRLRYQACSEHVCLAPTELELVVPVVMEDVPAP